MRQTDLAKHIGVSTATVGQYESGASNPSVEKLSKISYALEVTTDWLISGIDLDTYSTEQFDTVLMQRMEQQLEELVKRIDEKDRQLLEKDRFIIKLLKQVGKDKVIAGAARLYEVSKKVSSGCFAAMIGPQNAVPTA